MSACLVKPSLASSPASSSSPPLFFSFSRASFPRVNDRFCAPVSQHAAPLNPSLRFFHRFEVKMKKNRGTHSLNGTSSSKFFRIVSSEHFLRFRGIFSFLFLFLCKIDRKKRDRRSVLFIVKYHNTVVYTLNILRVFCMSIISIPHNVLHKYSRSGDSER